MEDMCYERRAETHEEPGTLTQGAPVFPGSSRLGIEPKTQGWLVQDPTDSPSAWLGSGGVGEPVVCRKSSSEDGAAGPRRPECECVERSRRHRDESATCSRADQDGQRRAQEGGRAGLGKEAQTADGRSVGRHRQLRKSRLKTNLQQSGRKGRCGKKGSTHDEPTQPIFQEEPFEDIAHCHPPGHTASHFTCVNVVFCAYPTAWGYHWATSFGHDST